MSKVSKKPLTGKQLMSQLPNDIVKKNPKYEKVESKINSGANAVRNNPGAHLNAIGQRKVTQGFKRIRLATLAKWMETAMIVLSEPDYVDSGESIYDLAGVANVGREMAESVTSTLSMAGTEATVCQEEPGVPPMYVFGPDIMDPDEVRQMTRQADRVENAVEGSGPNGVLQQQCQVTRQFESTQNQMRQNANKNTTSNFQLSEMYNSAPSTLSVVQQLTTRMRHQKLVERIHLKPDLQLEIFKGNPEAGKRPLPVPCATKQFVIIDMRSDADSFAANHLWGSVHLPVAMLHRVGARMPGPLHYFAKFEESIFVVVGLEGAELEKALNELTDYGLAQRNVVPLIQTFNQAQQEYPNLFVRL